MKITNFWNRFYNKFCQGDIIQLFDGFETHIGIYFTHLTLPSGRVRVVLAVDFTGVIGAYTFLLTKEAWNRAKLIVPVEESGGFFSAFRELKKRRVNKQMT